MRTKWKLTAAVLTVLFLTWLVADVDAQRPVRGRRPSGAQPVRKPTKKAAAKPAAKSKAEPITAIVGGDVSSGPAVMISVTVLGRLTDRPALRRDRARVQSGGLGAFALFTLTRRRRGPASRGRTDACPVCGAERTSGDPALTALRVWREIIGRRAAEPRLALGARLAPAPAAALETMLRALSGPPVAVVADPEMAPGAWALHS